MAKKRCGFYIEEKFIRKLGVDNKSKVLNDILAKHFKEEKENFKSDLQVIRDFSGELDDLKTAIFKQDILFRKRLDLIFNMTIYTAFSTDIIKEENQQKTITEHINKVIKIYEDLKEQENKF